MPATLDGLLELLTLERIEDDIFRGNQPTTSMQRVFGGQVLGQALMAVGRTVDPVRTVHSLHAYFLRLGDPTVPIAYVVEQTREGRSFSTRRVVARQHGRPIFQMSASFQIAEPGFEHQDPPPSFTGPTGLPSESETYQPTSRTGFDPREWAAIEVRTVPTPPPVEPAHHMQPGFQVWLRADGVLPDDPLLHAAILAYASDMTLLAVAGRVHLATLDGGAFVASLDHAMWFHRPFRVDEWLLHDEISPSASNARGFAEGRIFDQAGRLVASTVQEGVIRPDEVPG